MWVVGVGAALLPMIYGVCCLLSGHAILPSDGGADLDVHGGAAVALAVTYIAVGLFIHAEWFWGAHPRFSFLGDLLKIAACVTIIVSLGFAMFKILA